MAGEFSQGVMQFGKSVVAGLTGNKKSMTRDIGKRILKSNMTEGQKITTGKVKDIISSGMSEKAFDNFNKGVANAARVASKKGKNVGRVTNKLYANQITKNSFGYKLGDAMGGGFRSTYRSLKAGHGIDDALKAGFTKKVGGEWTTVSDGVRKKIGGKTQVRAGRVAGAVFGAGLAGRVATGGGLYRDRYGRVNVPGVPFI